ncbi:hypothetical protein L6164_027117 [Bauhinia variegata]|nr:hypothetical protein L6164_027117 [Bauhinia variegata]
MGYAASIFSDIQSPNLFMCNTMMRGYSISDYPNQAFAIFNNLRSRGIVLDQFSFITILKACGRQLKIGIGQGIHGIAVRSGNRSFVNVKNSLLHFYCVCSRIEDARKLFDESPEENDLVSWNTTMGGYLLASQPLMVLGLFREMTGRGLKPSVATVLSLLSAASDVSNFVSGKSLHGHCLRIGFTSDLNVLTALIDIYAKTGHMNLAHRVFEGVDEKDVVLWNCLIGKYARNGMVEEALALLQHMQLEGIKPNSCTMAGLLSACRASGAMHVGRKVTDYIEEGKLEVDAVLGTALVDMYSKCGFLDKALEIFERMDCKDVKSWTAMISGLAVHGQPTNAIKLFNRMEKEGYRPNEVTLLAILNACSHGGFVIEGVSFFKRMVEEYGFSPQIEHYGCVIDLLGRAGMLEEAYKLIKSLPIKGDATAWRTLLSACRVYGETELGECAKQVITKIYKKHPTDSLLICSAYAIAGRLPDHIRLQEMKESNVVRERGRVTEVEDEKMVKEAGLSIIEI